MPEEAKVRHGADVEWMAGDTKLKVSGPYAIRRRDDGSYPHPKYPNVQMGDRMTWFKTVRGTKSDDDGCEAICVEDSSKMMHVLFDTKAELDAFSLGLAVGSGSEKHMRAAKLRDTLIRLN